MADASGRATCCAEADQTRATTHTASCLHFQFPQPPSRMAASCSCYFSAAGHPQYSGNNKLKHAYELSYSLN